MQRRHRGKSQITVEREFNSLLKIALRIQTMAGVAFRFAPAYRFFSFLFVLFILGYGVSATAQWKELLHSNGYFSSIYFLDSPGPPRIGYAATVPDKIWRTEDGGITWQAMTPFRYPGSWPCDFTFKDSLTGWLAVRNNAGCYKTTDGGITWSFLPGSASDADGVHYNLSNGGLFLAGTGTDFDTASYWGGLASWDEGTTWTPIAVSLHGMYNGFAFNDSLDGIISSLFGPWLRTSDGGKSWATCPMDSEVWQPRAIPGTKTQFAITDHNGAFLRTDNLWSSWSLVHQFPISPVIQNGWDITSSGAVEGDSCHLFILLHDGCYMSTDEGVNWRYLGGMPTPGFFADWRFYVKGNYIYISSSIDGEGGFLWELNLDSLNPPNVGISEGFFNGAQQTTLHPGDSVGVTFVPGAGTLAATDSVELTLRYDPNAVSLSSLTLPAGWWVADSVSVAHPSGCDN
ncbi:MAG TPA: hypothetical protein VFH95_15750, partial [Candidatus Kapabacteria bacterium]|nr:hypothetical protein [Candidatus Kapabacteria bacterium]